MKISIFSKYPTRILIKIPYAIENLIEFLIFRAFFKKKKKLKAFWVMNFMWFKFCEWGYAHELF